MTSSICVTSYFSTKHKERWRIITNLYLCLWCRAFSACISNKDLLLQLMEFSYRFVRPSHCELKLHRTRLVDDCQPIAESGRPQLRSAHANVLTVPRTNTRLGDRSFSVGGSENLEHSNPSPRQPDIEFGHFKRLLKAFLFGETAAH